MLVSIALPEPDDGHGQRGGGGRPGSASGPEAYGEHVAIGEWSLTRAAWSDLHHHEELNYVLEGELHVTYDDQTFVARPGDVVMVPAGRRAR